VGGTLLIGRKVPAVCLSFAVLSAVLFVLTRPADHAARFAIRESRTATVVAPGSMPDVLSAVAAVDEQVEIYLSALEVARVQAIHDAWVAAIQARWYTVGRCEQPGSGEGGVQWTVQSSVYSGGLGISNAAWAQWGGLAYAPNAGQATPWQQMMVAESILATVGPRAWGCRVP
jgi:Transglycosylase-like domain